MLSVAAMAACSACGGTGPTTSRDILADPYFVEVAADRVRIDVGETGARGALRGEWSPDERIEGGASAASTSSRGGLISFLMLEPAESEVKLRCRSDEVQTLVPVLNGHRLAEVQVGTEWTNATFRVKKSFLSEGENLLFLKNGTRTAGIMVDYIAVGPQGWNFRGASGRPGGLASAPASSSSNQPLHLAPPRSRLSAYTYVPRDAGLAFEAGIQKEGSARGAAVRCTVTVEDDSGHARELSTRDLGLGFLKSSRYAGAARLDEYAGRTIRVSMRSEQLHGRQLPASVYWSARIVVPETGRRTAEPKQPGIATGPVVIYLVDALRADRLEPYGYGRPTSPRLAEFARDAVVFTHAYAQSAWTRASVASIMTGLYASSHLVEGRLDALPASVPMLPALLKEHGFAAYAFVTNGNISKSFGFAQPFDEYVQLREDASSPAVHVPSSGLFGVISSHPAIRRGKPLFIYVHATDPHAPHLPGPGDYSGLPGCTPEAEAKVSARQWRGDEAPGTAGELLSCFHALYDREVRHSDCYFGRFLDMLKQRGLYDHALIFFTADHGESFGEHDKWGHGKTLYQPELRVPLIVRLPGAVHGGQRVGAAVRHIDILPTIADVLGYDLPPGVQGRSLLEELDGTPPDPQPAFSELVLGPRPLAAMVFNGFKLLAEYQEDRAEYKLFDLVRDPGETRDLSVQHPITFHFMESALREWTDRQSLRKAALEKPAPATLDRETESVLRGLGYIQ
ncbi:MAG: sulfatase [Acidobacteriota bacterium]